MRARWDAAFERFCRAMKAADDLAAEAEAAGDELARLTAWRTAQQKWLADAVEATKRTEEATVAAVSARANLAAKELLLE